MFCGKVCCVYEGRSWENDLEVDGIYFLIRMTHCIECLKLKTTIFLECAYCKRLWAYDQLIT